jgi:hypothetical protein
LAENLPPDKTRDCIVDAVPDDKMILDAGPDSVAIFAPPLTKPPHLFGTALWARLRLTRLIAATNQAAQHARR